MKTKCILDEFHASVDENHMIVYDQETVRKAIAMQRGRSRHFLECAFNNRDLVFKKRKLACYAKTGLVRDLSASGGFCGTLANKVISDGGVVYGASYVDGFRHVKTVRVENMSDYFKLVSKSKYCYCQDCDFNFVKSELEAGKKVLFTGCPC